MTRCTTCNNEYYKMFTIQIDGKTFAFDCFECAIHKLAPTCNKCGCRIIGHGVEADSTIYCGAHCARAAGFYSTQNHTSHIDIL